MEKGVIHVELQEHMGSDRSIANSAWTSSYDLQKREDRTDEDVDRVVSMCAKNGHGTPFEAVVFRFWLRMPIFTDRQHMTHRIASHNGLSGRYRTMPTDYFLVPDDVQEILSRWEAGKDIQKDYDRVCSEVMTSYGQWIVGLKEARDEGVIDANEYKRVREVVRGAVPTSGMIERTTIMNLRSFANYIKLRADSHAQPEIQYVAKEMLRQVKEQKICPVAIEGLEKRGWDI